MLLVLGVAIGARAEDAALPPKAPKVAWIKAKPRLIELPEADPALDLVPTHALTANTDGRFLFGVTSGYTIAVEAAQASFAPYGPDARRAKPTVVTKRTRAKFPLIHGAPPALPVPVEFLPKDERWEYRLPVLLEVDSEAGTLCFLDADGDGWFDDLEDDKVAVGDAKQGAKLDFQPFTGEVTIRDKRYLVTANPREAGLWPVSAGVRKDYVRHVAEVNAMRRQAGLPAVGLAEELIPLCETHDRYCAKYGLGHAEDKGHPEYSEAGNYAGMHSNVGGENDAGDNVRNLLKTLWHRNAYYVKSLTRVGVGTAEGVTSSDVLTYASGGRTLIFAPTANAIDVPVRGANESPNPYLGEQRPGPFITVLLPAGKKAQFKSGTVIARGGDGKSLEFDVTDPTKPPPQAKQRFPDNDSCVVLVPHVALEPGTIYDVTITAGLGNKGETYAWAFRTAGGGD